MILSIKEGPGTGPVPSLLKNAGGWLGGKEGCVRETQEGFPVLFQSQVFKASQKF